MPVYYPASILPTQIVNPATGALASGFTLYAYLAGTTTPTNMFTDKNGTVAGSSITLNSGGWPEVSGSIVTIWLQQGVEYKFTLRDDEGAAEYTLDNITGFLSDEAGSSKVNTVADYDAIRGIDTDLYADGDALIVTNPGIAGTFILRNVEAHGLSDNGGTIIVINSNWYAERDFEEIVNVNWFEPDGVNDALAFQAALDTNKHVIAPDKKSWLFTTTPILRNSGQQLTVLGQIVLGGASGTAALQIGEPSSGYNVDFAKVWIQRIDGQSNTAGRDAIHYRYAVTCEVYVQRIINCRYAHHMQMTSATARFIHNDVSGNIISSCQIGIYQQNAVGGVTELDNEGNDFRVNIITGSVQQAFLIEENVRGNGSVIWCNFDAQQNYYVNKSAFGQPNILICTDWPEDQTGTGGTSDGSTAVITGLSSTSAFVAGCYVRPSAGFPSSILPYRVVSVDSASQITLDTNSNSVVAGAITVRRTNFFADRDVVIGDGLFKQGRRPFRTTYFDMDVSAAASNDMAMRFFNDGTQISRIGHNFSLNLALETAAGQQMILHNTAGVEMRNRIFLNGQTSTTLAAGNNNDITASAQTSVWRLTTDGGGSTLTGIAGGGTGRILKGVNLGPGTLTLAHESASSGSGNRINSGTGANVNVAVNGTFALWYDNTTTRWRIDNVFN